MRRRWPKGLISWSRLLAGKIRDPLVGRDILLGAAFGLAFGIAFQLFGLFAPRYGEPGEGIFVNSSLLYQHGFDGLRGFFPLLANQFSAAILFSLILTSAVLFFALITRRNKATVILTWLLLYVVITMYFGDQSPTAYALGLIAPSIVVFVLTRLGLLTLVTTYFFSHPIPFYPVTWDVSAWYATTWLMQLGLLAALVLFAFRTSLAGQKVLSDGFLDA